MGKTENSRIVAIDIFRALTMLMMIWVNDFWTLADIPKWLGHAQMDEDRLGLSDWVFPGFLFIVGLSIPFAMKARRSKGETNRKIFVHILKRSLALIIMGFFMVNLENINADLITFSKYFWQLLMALGIVLIWNIYPNKKALNKVPEMAMQTSGILILVFLALIFKGGSADAPTWMKPHWWGILGIIGWSYLLCATLVLLVGQRIGFIAIILIAFHLLNALEFMDLGGLKLKFMVSASHHVSVMGGVLISLFYLKLGSQGFIKKFLMIVLLITLLHLLYGFLSRPIWEISKIRATPSWASICLGISMVSFVGIFILTDIFKNSSWASLISPAGRSTLTCYLVPYFYYPIMALIGITLPEFFRTGVIGLFKSLLFALLIVLITGVFERLNIRLKV